MEMIVSHRRNTSLMRRESDVPENERRITTPHVYEEPL